MLNKFFPAAFLFLVIPAVAEDEYVPAPPIYIYEQYDEAVIQHFQREGNDWQTHRIYFCRDKKVIAERYFDPSDFRVTVKPDNKINIAWIDYGMFDRSIDVDGLSEGPGIIEDDGNQNWFFMARRMTDLRTSP